jgi:hypothetical protein
MEVMFPRVHGALCSSGGVIVSNVQDTRKTRVINSTMLRTKTRDILEQAKFQGEHFIVETFGKPMVAIVGVEEYWELVNQAGQAEPSETGE